MPVKTTLNLSILNRAFEGTVREFARACQDTFDDPLWTWPATTRRRNGQVVSSPRNIVDLGELKASQQPPEFLGNSAVITWDAEHAAAVFRGAVFRKREHSLPARNLPAYVARNFDWNAAFARHFK